VAIVKGPAARQGQAGRMIGTHRIEMSNVVGVEILQPHDAGNAINAIGNFGRFVAAELFATTNHGYNSRQSPAASGESRPNPQ